MTPATTMRAISGLSRQTPSLRMTKSARSKTCALTKSNTARSTFGRSGIVTLPCEECEWTTPQRFSSGRDDPAPCAHRRGA